MNEIRNRIRCKKCDDVIESLYRHDFKVCKCGSVSVDGGKSYSKRSWPEGRPEDWIEEMP